MVTAISVRMGAYLSSLFPHGGFGNGVEKFALYSLDQREILN